jgi:homoserine O-succinyltransferase
LPILDDVISRGKRMPVCLNSSPASHNLQPCAKVDCGRPSDASGKHSDRIITIGLINNMPDGALEATERQFLSLLDAASDGIHICLSLYSIPSVPRGEFGARHIRESYSNAEELLERQVDGLIVTGREPAATDFAEEPYWESFTNVLEWARENTYSTVWSCLAAHAAVYYLDGIKRVKSSAKSCGVFECSRLREHPLVAGTPSQYRLPHSRWNGLPEDQLTANGYDIVTRADEFGVDSFTKDLNSMFVFFQGHPEYESSTLMSEYRRDVGRYLRSETGTYPSMPRGYFDPETVHALTAIRQEAESNARKELLSQLSSVLEKTRIDNTWNTTAVQIYRNWLQEICARKDRKLRSRVAAAETNTQIVSKTFPLLSTAIDTRVSFTGAMPFGPR